MFWVLILGNRYGFTLPSGKSVTNMEYITARNKGIPIYVFIDKRIINILPVYKDNKEGKFENIVDKKEILDFADEIRNSSGLWTFPFEKFQDVIYVLKTQLSYLFKESLILRNKFQLYTDYEFHSKLSTKALKILLTKGLIFEFEFMPQVFIDELQKFEYLRKDYEHKLVLQVPRRISDDQEFITWCLDRISIAMEFIESLGNVAGQMLLHYFGESGVASDLKGLHYCANAYARVYASLINWAIDTYSTIVEDHQMVLKNILSELNAKIIKDVWQYPFTVQEQVNAVKIGNNGQHQKLDMTIHISMDAEQITKCNEEIAKFNNHFLQSQSGSNTR